jgi:cytidylate kinase
MSISAALLARQDDRTSEAVVALLKGNAAFAALSTTEGNDIVTRDHEDDVKLAVGIQYAVSKGVLPKDSHVDPVHKIVVTGKSADQVANEMISVLPGKHGNVIVLQGLSGTGKGTTVKRLQHSLPQCVCWSNGNVFRTFTHLASKHCEDNGIEFSKDVLTPELLQSFVQRISFVKFDDGFDVVIDGTIRVSTIQNTILKMPHISSRVPTVAELTQGEVVLFGANAVDILKGAGCNVILEGRAQTLNYIPTPLRFELVMENVALLGERRAAQRVMAAAHKALGEAASTAADDAVTDAVLKAVENL